MFKINKNIYLVHGASCACIYNLNTRRLIPVSHETVPSVQQLFLTPTLSNPVAQRMIEEKVMVDEDTFESCDSIQLNEDSIQIAWIEVNTECNFKCVHCYVADKHLTSIKRISLSDFKLAVDRVVEYGINRIHIIGGEPMIHPDFWQMMEYALPKFSFSVLFTNGFFITRDSVSRLEQLGLSEIDVSLYSTIESEHEKVTLKKGSFSRTMNAINILEQSEIICHIATIRVPGINIGDEYQSKNEKPAVQHFDYMRASGRGKGKWSEDDLLLGNKEITSNIVNRIIDPQKVLFKMRFHNCFGRYIRINPNLDVFPCTMEQRFLHGNIRSHRIADLINEHIRTFNKDKVQTCCVCEYRYICSDCRPDTFSDNVCAKPWFCRYNPLSGEWVSK